jgi:hypothetical protein
VVAICASRVGEGAGVAICAWRVGEGWLSVHGELGGGGGEGGCTWAVRVRTRFSFSVTP